MPSRRQPTQAQRAVALGALVRQLRRASGLTQRQLAQRIPMSAGNVSRIETGTQGPPADETIIRLARALDADPAELLRAAGRVPHDSADTPDNILAELRQLAADLRHTSATTCASLGRIEAALDAKRPSKP